MKRNRKGAATVEFAVVLPVFLMLVLGMLEFGRIMMVQQLMTNAAREGARVATFDGATLPEVQQKVRDYTPTLSPTLACSPAPGSAGYGQLQTVTLSVPLSKVTWLPVRFLPAGTVLTASSSMRREAVQ